MPAARSAARRISATSSARGSSPGREPSRNPLKPVMTVIMLLTSCATPPATRATASIRSACTSSSAARRRSVTSLHHAADPLGAPVGGHGVIAREEGARAVVLGARLDDDLAVEHRRAGTEHLLEQRHDQRRARAQHVRYGAAEVRLDGSPVERGERVVDPDEPQLAIDEREADRRAAKDRVEQGDGARFLVQGLLGLRYSRALSTAMAARRARSSPSSWSAAAIVPAGLGHDEGDRAQRPTAGGERHDEKRPQAEGPQAFQMVLVPGEARGAARPGSRG